MATHSALGRMVGLTAERICDNRLGSAVDPKADALIQFALKSVDTCGRVGDSDFHEFLRVGFDDAAMTHVVANVALHVFITYFNRRAGTDLNFLEVPSFEAPASSDDLMSRRCRTKE